MAENLLELRGITRIYPAVRANDGVDLTVRRGEIHAVLGENGAGKSTLMRVIYGSTQPDAGTIIWQGEAVQMRSPACARSLGIGMVFQHFSLFETLSVAENISLAVSGTLDDLSQRIRAVAEAFGLPVAPDTLVHSLSVGERQRVEIIRCLLQQPKLLILDEPTSVLPPQGVRRLFETLRKLAAGGCSILYISHKLEEIRALCDRATVLRYGKVTGVADPRSESTESLARLMIGRDIPHPEHPPPAQDGAQRLRIEGLNRTAQDPYGTALKNVSLEVRAGEVVGIAGISGNGQNELMRVVSGEDLLDAGDGQIEICTTPAGRLSPVARRRLGLNFVPEERLGRGAVAALSLAFNGLLTAFERGMTQHQLLRFERIRAFAADCVEHFDVRGGGIEANAGSLSGGNLQKFIVGRELSQTPRLLVLSQPTWGIDIGAAAAIKQRLVDLREQGAGILLVSEELEELFEVADRIAVMYAGTLTAAVPVRSTDVEAIGRLMSGVRDEEAA
ncbi:MAG: ATP-binding cassette domain-containing protein [Gammaproteobacteria bacterium]|nr:ATP-binding cassette domain-containing protein [Gammaproteobacteria bacterium]